jgi:hypothetical protein
MLKPMLFRRIIICAALLTAAPGYASIPVAITRAGDSVVFDIDIDGMISGALPSFGSFDFALAFDPSLVLPAGVTFNLEPGNPAPGKSITVADFLPGLADFGQVSLLLPAGLDESQPSRFPLASLSFQAAGNGQASSSVVRQILDDAFGNKTPEPGSLILGVLGLAALAMGIRRTRAEKGSRTQR